MITGIRDVFYFVSDMERSVAFYRALLGQEPIEPTPHWTAFSLGGVRFALHWTGGEPVPQLPGGAHGSPAGATVTLQTSDIDAEHQRLSELGVRWLTGIERQPWGNLATFADEDGNVLKLMQPPVMI